MMVACSPQTRHVLSCVAVVVLVSSSNALAGSEDDVKAAYVFNFIKFIEWPSGFSDQHIDLCVIGSDPITSRLVALDRLRVKGLPMRVSEISIGAESFAAQCDLVFIGETEALSIKPIINALTLEPEVLSISAIEGFVESGGMFGLLKYGNVVKFSVNLKRARDAKLMISSKLLELAYRVIQ